MTDYDTYERYVAKLALLEAEAKACLASGVSKVIDISEYDPPDLYGDRFYPMDVTDLPCS